MKRLSNFFPLTLFSILSFVIVFPFLPTGYILTMDKVIADKILLPDITSTHFLFDGLMSILNLIIPTFWIQKIILFLIFFLSSLGMYKIIPEKTGFARYFGAIFYSINPFVYERVMAGHWQLLLGYSLFPFIINLTFSFFQHPSKLRMVILALLTTLLFNIDIHFLLIYSVFFVLAFSLFVLFNRNKLALLLKPVLTLLLLILLFNSNWIAGSILGQGEDIQALSSFSRDDLIAFQSVPDQNFGLIFNLLSGYGFWPEVYDYFISPKSVNIFWPLISVVIILISFYGVYQYIKQEERKAIPFIITLIIMFLLALDFAGGVALKSSANVFYYLYNLFPFIRGFREPQKLIGIVILCYAFFGSMGIYYLGEKIARKAKPVIIGIFIILPFVYTPTLFASFWGQLRPVLYPSSWEKVNQILKEDKGDFLTLFFPWHQYMRFRFANNMVVANPAPYYFSKPILSSQNYETEYLDRRDTRMDALHVNGLLSIEKEKINLLGDKVNEKIVWGEALAPINVKYLILAKEDDWESYRFLDLSKDLENIFEDDNLIFYKNNRWSFDSNKETEPIEEYTEEDLDGFEEN